MTSNVRFLALTPSVITLNPLPLETVQTPVHPVISGYQRDDEITIFSQVSPAANDCDCGSSGDGQEMKNSREKVIEIGQPSPVQVVGSRSLFNGMTREERLPLLDWRPLAISPARAATAATLRLASGQRYDGRQLVF